MPEALAGETVNAQDIVDTIVADIASDASVGTIASGFTLQSATVDTALGGHLVDFTLYVATTADRTATNGNLSDITCFTLDAAYRPASVKSSVLGSGTTSGEAILNTDGTVVLRAASDSITTSFPNIRMQFVYLIP